MQSTTRLTNRRLFGGLVALLVICNSASVVAASSVTVTPAFLTIAVSKAEPIVQSALGVRNDSESSIDLRISLTGINQQNGGFVITDTPDPILEKVIRIERNQIHIEPHQSVNVQLSSYDSDELSPGGHYAALLIKQTSDSDTRRSVSVQPAVSVMMFLTKEDGAKRSLEIVSQNFPVVAFSVPHSIKVAFKNTGNVAVIPRASVQLVHGLATYATATVNAESLSVFPEQNGTYNVPLQSVGMLWLPHRYKLSVTYRYNGTNETKNFVKNVTVIPWQTLVIAAIFFGVIIWQRIYIWKVTVSLISRMNRKKRDRK